MKKKIFFYTLTSLIIILSLSTISYLRSEGFSDRIKGILIPQLEKFSGYEVNIGRISLTPLPTYFEFRDIRMKDNDGKERLYLKRCRIFFNPVRILTKQLYLTRIELDELNIKTPLDKIPIPFTKNTTIGKENMEIIPVEVVWNGGRIDTWKGTERLVINNPSLRINIKKGHINIKKIEFSYTRGDEINISLTTSGYLRYRDKEKTLELKEFVLQDPHSKLTLKGIYSNRSFEGLISGHLSSESLPPVIKNHGAHMAEVDLHGSFGFGRLKRETGFKEALKKSTFNLKVKGYTDLQFLMKLVKAKEPLDGRTEFKGTLKGNYSSPQLSLNATMKNGSIYGIHTDELKTSIEYKNGIMTFKDSTVKAYNGTAKAEVKIALPKVKWYSVTVMADNLDSKPLLKLIKFDPGLPTGKVKGYLLSRGKKFSPSGRFIYYSLHRGDAFSPLNRIKHIDGRFNLRDNRLRLYALKIESNKGVVTSHGIVNLKEKEINLNYILNTENLGEFIEILQGKADIEGVVRGKTSNPLIQGRIKTGNFKIGNISLGDTQGMLSYYKGIVNIHSFMGAMYQGQYTLNGYINTGSSKPFALKEPTLELQLSYSSLPVNTLLNNFSNKFTDDFKGHIKGIAKITGDIKSPRIEASVESTDLSFRNISLGRVASKFTFADKRYSIKDLSIKKGRSQIMCNIFYYGRGDFEIKDGQILVFSKDLTSALKEEVLLKAHLSGISRNNRPDITLAGTLKGKDTELGHIELRYLKDTISMYFSLLNEKLRLEGSLLPDTWQWNLDIKANNGRYEELIGYFIDIPEDFELNFSMNSSLTGTGLENLDGRINFSKLVYNLYGYNFINIGDILLSLRKDNINIDSFKMKAGPATFNLTGNITTSGNINLTAFGSSYLTPIKTLVSGIESIKGEIDFVLGLTGTIEEPLINGGLLINETSVELSYFVERFKGISGYAYIDNNRLVVESLKGSFGGGDITLVGSAYIKKWKLRDYNMDFSLNNVGLQPMEDVWFTTKGQLSLSELKGVPLLVGDLIISKARFKRDINWRSMILSRKVSAKSHKGISRHIELNITIRGDEDIMIENNLVTAPVKIDLLMRGTLSNPSLLGRIEFMGGKFFFRNNEFIIEKASADFVDPEGIYPFFDVLATTRIHEYSITLALNGYIDEFSLSLTSTPYLSEMDIISLLTTRRISKNLRGLEGGIGVAEATAFLTGQLQETLEERIQGITGFDRVEVGPYISEKTGEIGPRVTVAKRLLSDRLYVTYSTSFGSEAEQFLKLEFALSDKISLVGERDETGTIGADIKFRIEFR